MCIMQVKAHAHLETMAQAMTHNASTMERDIEMLETVLRARGEHEPIADCAEAKRAIHRAYSIFQALFEREMARERAEGLDRDYPHEHHDRGRDGSMTANEADGNERAYAQTQALLRTMSP
jgi:hypothetical protein